MKVLPSVLLLSATWLAACTDTPTAPNDVDAAGALLAAKAAPARDSVLLGVTVADGPYQIQSDGLGEYLNGSAGMGAVIDMYGNLQISPFNATASSPPQRRLNVTYPAGQSWTFPTQWNFKIKSNTTNNGNPRIQDMAIGAALCYNVTIAHRTQAVQYVDSFNPAAYPSSSYALITRTSATTWTMTSNGPGCGAADVAWVTGTDLTVKRGGSFTVGAVPQAFSITLRALP